MVENYEAKTLNRTQIETYLNSIQGANYAWFSENLNRKDLLIVFETITNKKTVSSRFQIVAHNYLNVAYYEYYYPERYEQDSLGDLQVLPNSVLNGFSSLYSPEGPDPSRSRGRYDPSDTQTDYDPHGLNLALD